MKKEDINVAIDGNQVAITAEVKHEKEVKEGEKVLRSERYYGKVYRAFRLAQDIDEAATQAKYIDGVLELTTAEEGRRVGAKRLDPVTRVRRFERRRPLVRRLFCWWYGRVE